MDRSRAAGEPTSLRGVHRRGGPYGRPTRLARRPYVQVAIVALAGLMLTVGAVVGHTATTNMPFEIQSLDGKGNNLAHPDWGSAGAMFQRIGRANFADGIGAPVDGPNARFVSNRIFNDIHQNLFNKHDLSRWASFWGQFLAMDMSLKAAGTDEKKDITFNANDPLETFTDTLNVIPFTRSAVAPGTGATTPRQQINTQSSFLDMSQLYGTTADRLKFLRAGNNDALFLLPGGQLPRKDARGDAAKAPDVQVDGRLKVAPARAAVAGDKRANQTVAMQAIFTLFAREHNRIVSQLPKNLTPEQKFQIARRVVIAEEQFITFNQFLPTLGVKLAPFAGYNPNLNPTAFNEFAAIGFRMHSMIHGALDMKVDADRYSAAQLAAFKTMGIEVKVGAEDGAKDSGANDAGAKDAGAKDAGGSTADAKRLSVQVPLTLIEFNPDLLPQLQLGPVLEGFGVERQYFNDEQIDNQLRSALFQIPVPGNVDCLDGAGMPTCFKGVLDLGAVDIERARDHGLPLYNNLRRALGLAPNPTFMDITGEATESFPASAGLKQGEEVNDPRSLDFVRILDADGKQLKFLSDDAQENAMTGVRRTTTAARLKAIYGSVSKVDAFVGMVSERHVQGTEFGSLQLALWKKQFTGLRDGDRFFFGNDPGLSTIQRQFGINFRRSLADIIAANTDVKRSDLNDNVFLVKDDDNAKAGSAKAGSAAAGNGASDNAAAGNGASDRNGSNGIATGRPGGSTTLTADSPNPDAPPQSPVVPVTTPGIAGRSRWWQV